jgi:hypothetical protein
MDPTIDAMLIVYAAALRRHQQHLEDGCDRSAWHVLARHPAVTDAGRVPRGRSTLRQSRRPTTDRGGRDDG